MWELMTGKKPFWDQNHDIALINKLCDGFRPPILINAPKGYIELMQECWHFDPCKRPPTFDIQSKLQLLEIMKIIRLLRLYHYQIMDL
jgi:hypothetical protein